jgi:hypothetical protein
MNKFKEELEQFRRTYGNEMIMNMDETMIRYINGCDHVWRNKFSTAKMKTCVDEKAGVTAVLTITASGMKLPCMIIKRGTTYRSVIELQKQINTAHKQTENVLGETSLAYSESGWMNRTIMLQYLEEVIQPYTQNKECVLVLDNYGSHVTEEVKKKAEEMKITIFPLPTNTTHLLQPLDVSVNGVVKQISKRKRREKEERKEKPISNQNEATMHVIDIWNDDVKNNTVIKSWHKACGMDIDHLQQSYQSHHKKIEAQKKEETKKRKREIMEKGKNQVEKEEEEEMKKATERKVKIMKERDKVKVKKQEKEKNEKMVQDLQKIHKKNVQQSKNK